MHTISVIIIINFVVKFNPMKFLLTTITAMAILGTSCTSTFNATEREIIRQGEEIMRLTTIDDEADSLILRQISKPLSRRDVASEEFSTLCRRMLSTVRNPENEGVGIAAPQVGILRRLVAVQRFDKEGEPFEFYINPKIVEYGEDWELGGEGCLSVPDFRGDVWRAQSIKISYRDAQYRLHREIVEGFTAVIFQHEIDHLDGILYIDRLDDDIVEQPTEEVAEETTEQ